MDIVISDMVMPGMDGLELLKKAMRLNVDVPFSWLRDTVAGPRQVYAGGASDYLTKPVTSGGADAPGKPR
jgi:CheY-like chemotaxis protein